MTMEVVCRQCNTLFQVDEVVETVCPSCGQELSGLTKEVVREEEPPSGTDDWYEVYLEEVNRPILPGKRRSEKGDRTHSRMRAMKAKLAKYRRQSRYFW